MEIERRQLFTVSNHSRDAVHTREQPNERRGRLEYHRRTQLRNAFRVSTELQHVAQALLAMQQDHSAGDAFASQPQRLLETPWITAGYAKAPLVIDPTVGEITQREAGHRAI